jgi:uncharacterized MAPEG superfamily protein
MTPELMLLAWSLVLALVQILLPPTFRAREVSLSYNAGPRDTPPPTPPGIYAGRLYRAQHNLFETLPLFIAAVLIIHVTHLESTLTYWGAMLYFWARVVYVPLYAFGIPYARSAAWFVSLIGLVMLIDVLVCPHI